MSIIDDLSPDKIKGISNEELRQILSEVVKFQKDDVKENQLLYYKPVSPVAGKIHQSVARVVGVGGGNRCLPLHSPVLMADGTWKQLGEVAVGDRVLAADPITGRASPASVKNIFRSGRNPVYRTKFSDGGFIEATPEHIIPMYLGSGRKTSKGNEKYATKRRLGDYLEPIQRRGQKNPSKRISMVSPRYISFIEGGILPLHPYLLGALLGDGSISQPKGVRFSNKDEAVVSRVAQHVIAYDCRLVKVAGNNCDYGISTNINGKNRISDALRSLGLQGKNSYTKFIPREYLTASIEDRLQLLAGLVDTDGGINLSFSTCSDQLAEDFVFLVRSLGGKATSNKHSSMCQNGVSVDYHLIYWRMNDPVPLSMPEKQRIKKSRRNDYGRRVCREVELVGQFECGDIEVDHPSHCYIAGDWVIVSNSSKTTTLLAEHMIALTGIVPISLRDNYPMTKLRGPINGRIICESLTTVLHPIMLPKLQYWRWNGPDEPGGVRGHWGLIPRQSLIDGSWEKSWSEKNRLLRLNYRDPVTHEIVGESTLQFMSHDQDPSDFSSGDMHIVQVDEPPRYAIWRENQARVMAVRGRILLGMTWPDDPSIPVDWLFDEVYDPAQPGPNHDPNTEWYELYTVDNQNIDQESIREQMAKWSDRIKAVRIYGRPMRFSNRIHPLFTDILSGWCFKCGCESVLVDEKCSACQSEDVTTYNHVREFDYHREWPVICLLDPHPRKPHMLSWIAVDSYDDLWQIAETQVDGDPTEVRKAVDEIERTYGMNVVQRIMDPNMGASPSGAVRGVTWQNEFRNAGLIFDLADDSDVGRSRLNEYLKPDPRRLQPRVHVHQRCRNTIFQLKRFCWDEHKESSEKDLKQRPKPKNDDFPALWRYALNTNPTYVSLTRGHAPIRYAR